MDVLLEQQDEWLAWLESVDHLLQKDELSTRAEAVTGFYLSLALNMKTMSKTENRCQTNYLKFSRKERHDTPPSSFAHSLLLIALTL